MRKHNLNLRSRKKAKVNKSPNQNLPKSQESSESNSKINENIQLSKNQKNKKEKLQAEENSDLLKKKTKEVLNKKIISAESETEKSILSSDYNDNFADKSKIPSAAFVRKINDKIFEEDEKPKVKNNQFKNNNEIKTDNSLMNDRNIRNNYNKNFNENNNENHIYDVIIQNKHKIMSNKINNNKDNSFDGSNSFEVAKPQKNNSEYQKHLENAIPKEAAKTRKNNIPKIENFEKIKVPRFFQGNETSSNNNNNIFKKLSKVNNQKIMLLNKYSQKLNSEWVPYFDKNGVVYFYNRISGDTSFNFPKVYNHSVNRYENLFFKDWIKIQDKQSKSVYWKNLKYGYVQYIKPASTVYLLESVFLENLAFVIFYLEHSGDVNILDKKGRNALHYLAMNDSVSILNILLENRIKTEVEELKEKQTPIFYAMKYSSFKVLKILIERKANINHRDIFGNTLLHYCVKLKNKKLIIFLIHNGARLDIKNAQNKFPIDIAVQNNDWETVEFIVKISNKKNKNQLMHKNFQNLRNILDSESNNDSDFLFNKKNDFAANNQKTNYKRNAPFLLMNDFNKEEDYYNKNNDFNYDNNEANNELSLISIGEINNLTLKENSFLNANENEKAKKTQQQLTNNNNNFQSNFSYAPNYNLNNKITNGYSGHDDYLNKNNKSKIQRIISIENEEEISEKDNKNVNSKQKAEKLDIDSFDLNEKEQNVEVFYSLSETENNNNEEEEIVFKSEELLKNSNKKKINSENKSFIESKIKRVFNANENNVKAENAITNPNNDYYYKNEIREKINFGNERNKNNFKNNVNASYWKHNASRFDNETEFQKSVMLRPEKSFFASQNNKDNNHNNNNSNYYVKDIQQDRLIERNGKLYLISVNKEKNNNNNIKNNQYNQITNYGQNNAEVLNSSSDFTQYFNEKFKQLSDFSSYSLFKMKDYFCRSLRNGKIKMTEAKLKLDQLYNKFCFYYNYNPDLENQINYVETIDTKGLDEYYEEMQQQKKSSDKEKNNQMLQNENALIKNVYKTSEEKSNENKIDEAILNPNNKENENLIFKTKNFHNNKVNFLLNLKSYDNKKTFPENNQNIKEFLFNRISILTFINIAQDPESNWDLDSADFPNKTAENYCIENLLKKFKLIENINKTYKKNFKKILKIKKRLLLISSAESEESFSSAEFNKQSVEYFSEILFDILTQVFNICKNIKQNKIRFLAINSKLNFKNYFSEVIKFLPIKNSEVEILIEFLISKKTYFFAKNASYKSLLRKTIFQSADDSLYLNVSGLIKKAGNVTKYDHDSLIEFLKSNSVKANLDNKAKDSCININYNNIIDKNQNNNNNKNYLLHETSVDFLELLNKNKNYFNNENKTFLRSTVDETGVFTHTHKSLIIDNKSCLKALYKQGFADLLLALLKDMPQKRSKSYALSSYTNNSILNPNFDKNNLVNDNNETNNNLKFLYEHKLSFSAFSKKEKKFKTFKIFYIDFASSKANIFAMHKSKKSKLKKDKNYILGLAYKYHDNYHEILSSIRNLNSNKIKEHLHNLEKKLKNSHLLDFSKDFYAKRYFDILIKSKKAKLAKLREHLKAQSTGYYNNYYMQNCLNTQMVEEIKQIINSYDADEAIEENTNNFLKYENNNYNNLYSGKFNSAIDLNPRIINNEIKILSLHNDNDSKIKQISENKSSNNKINFKFDLNKQAQQQIFSENDKKISGIKNALSLSRRSFNFNLKPENQLNVNEDYAYSMKTSPNLKEEENGFAAESIRENNRYSLNYNRSSSKADRKNQCFSEKKMQKNYLAFNHSVAQSINENDDYQSNLIHSERNFKNKKIEFDNTNKYNYNNSNYSKVNNNNNNYDAKILNSGEKIKIEIPKNQEIIVEKLMHNREKNLKTLELLSKKSNPHKSLYFKMKTKNERGNSFYTSNFHNERNIFENDANFHANNINYNKNYFNNSNNYQSEHEKELFYDHEKDNINFSNNKQNHSSRLAYKDSHAAEEENQEKENINLNQIFNNDNNLISNENSENNKIIEANYTNDFSKTNNNKIYSNINSLKNHNNLININNTNDELDYEYSNSYSINFINKTVCQQHRKGNSNVFKSDSASKIFVPKINLNFTYANNESKAGIFLNSERRNFLEKISSRREKQSNTNNNNNNNITNLNISLNEKNEKDDDSYQECSSNENNSHLDEIEKIYNKYNNDLKHIVLSERSRKESEIKKLNNFDCEDDEDNVISCEGDCVTKERKVSDLSGSVVAEEEVNNNDERNN